MKLKVFVLVLALLFENGESLKCFSCETHDINSPCEDLAKGKDKIKTEDCSEGEICAIYKTKNPLTGLITMKRSCEPKDICEELHEQESEFKKIQKCKICKTDLCDTGTTLTLSATTFLFSLLLCALIN